MKHLDQLSIFIENRAGELYKITSLLTKEKVSLLSIMLSDSTEFGILRLLTKETERAQKLLAKGGITAQKTSVLAVRIDDFAGSFDSVVAVLTKAQIDIRYTYTVNEKNDGIFVFKVDDDKLADASHLLESAGVRVVGEEEL
jgi:hypothetical protein